MCGRYVSTLGDADLARLFEARYVDPEERLEPDWNVAPTKRVWAVLDRPLREDAAGGAGGGSGGAPVRQLRVLRWGLVPSWAKDRKIGSRLINARAETVHEKPAFRSAFARRRCLLPADGFYEWYAAEGGGKVPFYFTNRDGSPMAFAGLYEFWRDPEGAWLASCTIITTEATDAVGRVHPRMPLQISEPHRDAWLDPEHTDPVWAQALLRPADSADLDGRPVSTAVNSVRNNGPELLAG